MLGPPESAADQGIRPVPGAVIPDLILFNKQKHSLHLPLLILYLLGDAH